MKSLPRLPRPYSTLTEFLQNASTAKHIFRETHTFWRDSRSAIGTAFLLSAMSEDYKLHYFFDFHAEESEIDFSFINKPLVNGAVILGLRTGYVLKYFITESNNPEKKRRAFQEWRETVQALQQRDVLYGTVEDEKKMFPFALLGKECLTTELPKESDIIEDVYGSLGVPARQLSEDTLLNTNERDLYYDLLGR